MSKAHRGKGIRDQAAHGRGECPVCKRSNVKTLYEQEAEGQKFKICKTCRAAIKNGKKKLPVVAVEKPATPATPVAEEPVAAAAPAATVEAPATETPVAETPAAAVETPVAEESAVAAETPVAEESAV